MTRRPNHRPASPFESTHRTNGYVDLRSYAAIGDTRSVALVAHDGSIDWYPIPTLDSTPVFGRLLDSRTGGMFELRPVADFSVSRRYLPGTNVLRTTFVTDTGTVEVTDSLNIGTTGPLPWNELVRKVEGISGEVDMRWQVAPGTGLGVGMPWTEQVNGVGVAHLKDVTLAVIAEGSATY